MNIGGIVFDDRAIDQARQLFDLHGAQRKSSLDFDGYLQLLVAKCSFADIAIKTEVSREAIRLMYNRYFRNLFPKNPSGHGRLKTFRVERIMTKAHEIAEEGLLEEVARAAVAAGCTIEKIPRQSSHSQIGSKFKTSEILINGRSCSTLLTAKPYTMGRREVNHLNLQKERVEQHDFIVILRKHGDERTFFIVPCAKLLAGWDDMKPKSFYIPLRAPTHGSHIDWKSYENAWPSKSKCIQCGRQELQSAKLCLSCLTKWNTRTKDLKNRNIAAGRCAWCSHRNRSKFRTCKRCRDNYNARRNARKQKAGNTSL